MAGIPPQPFLPEQPFLSFSIPTRDRAELRTFVNHCTYLLQQRPEVQINHPITELQQITTHPVVFEGYIWRYRIVISRQGIIEDYRTVERTRTLPETARLIKFCTAFYSWDARHWTVELA